MRIEDYQDTLRGHRVLHLVDKGNKLATMPLRCRCSASSGPAADSAPKDH